MPFSFFANFSASVLYFLLNSNYDVWSILLFLKYGRVATINGAAHQNLLRWWDPDLDGTGNEDMARLSTVKTKALLPLLGRKAGPPQLHGFRRADLSSGWVCFAETVRPRGRFGLAGGLGGGARVEKVSARSLS